MMRRLSLTFVAASAAALALTLACSGTPDRKDAIGPGGGGPDTTTPPYVEPPEPAWSFCSNAGEVCTFTGLREVRFGPSAGPWLTKVAFGSIPCGFYEYGGDPAPGQTSHCDYAPIKRDTIVNPNPMGPVTASRVIVPSASPGFAETRRETTSETPAVVDGSGAFRTTCVLSKVQFDDPIVYPGQPGKSHLHIFFGNTAVDGRSTPESIRTTGNSTCRGGTLNRTAYWAPALMDTRSRKIVTPEFATFYYKTGYNIPVAQVTAPPAGLRMIAGDKNATGRQEFAGWLCRHPNGTSSNVTADGTIPTNCAVGDIVRFQIIFPQCWDGQHLDSPDHKSHMAYPIYANRTGGSQCPSTHPVIIPEITEFFDYLVTDASAPRYWRLSSDMYPTTTLGGRSAHADWFNGWDEATMNTIVTRCLNRGVDCGVGSIGDGTTLY